MYIIILIYEYIHESTVVDARCFRASWRREEKTLFYTRQPPCIGWTLLWWWMCAGVCKSERQ